MRGHGRLRALPAIKAAGEKDWRAWDGWLKLTHPAEYRGSGAKIEVSASANANLPVISEEKLRELEEIRRRLSRETNQGEPSKGQLEGR